jgi:lipoprotein signal peptidase
VFYKNNKGKAFIIVKDVEQWTALVSLGVILLLVIGIFGEQKQ